MILSEVEVCALGEKFRDMVCKEAWKVWQKLPAHTKSWVSLEDIIQDGMIKLITEIIPKWDSSRTKLSTLAHVSIHNHLDECYTCKFAGRWKETPSGRRWYKRRDERNTVGIEDLAANQCRLGLGERRNCWDVLHSLSRSVVYSGGDRECWVVPLLCQVYTNASESLQNEMMQWFLTGERHRLNTAKFSVASSEFRELAEFTGLVEADCQHLFKSPECMDELSIEWRGVPYELPQLAYA